MPLLHHLNYKGTITIDIYNKVFRHRVLLQLIYKTCKASRNIKKIKKLHICDLLVVYRGSGLGRGMRGGVGGRVGDWGLGVNLLLSVVVPLVNLGLV